ncbi:MULTISPECIES: efflux RND transporter periplasmic adaptor subunit [Marinomonas]|uniref:Efflux RND transporter periplasmic adaptor subunit n=1 Tax=Marinomonas arctica TaxID=383750 RepID=A0A7H1J7H1_9GAMM|nr:MULTISPECIES: efflux RND transporter periplasmic adaptor subunit [Marinomonas]QNT06437.1 efflux RND transporter periplasmic adaptor subunit [Marinomonas arctica]
MMTNILKYLLVPTAITVALCSASVALARTASIVQLEPVTQKTIVNEIDLVGTINAIEASTLSSYVSGIVKTVHVKEGDAVKKGDTLLSLDDELTRFEHQKAVSSVNEANIRFAEAKRLLKEAESLQAGRDISITEVQSRKSNVQLLQSQVAQLQAEESRLRALLSQHHLRAPYSGIISERFIHVGEWAAQGVQMFALTDDSGLTADFRIPEHYYAKISTRAAITLDCNGQKIASTITHQVPVSDRISRTFLIKTDVSACNNFLPGVSVKATLKLPNAETGLLINRDAINRYPNGRTTVWVASKHDEEGHYIVSEKAVTPGTYMNNTVEVLDSELQQDQLIVTRGNEGLMEGNVVRVADSGA